MAEQLNLDTCTFCSEERHGRGAGLGGVSEEKHLNVSDGFEN